MGFIRYGDPTPVEYTDIPKWNPAQKSRAACIYMDINLKPQERHRMFSERMTFWNMFTYKEMLEEYAVDNKEARMLIEIETAIDESEDDAENEEEGEEVRGGARLVWRGGGGRAETGSGRFSRRR